MDANLNYVISERTPPAAQHEELDLEALSAALSADGRNSPAVASPGLYGGACADPLDTLTAAELHYGTNFTVMGLQGVASYYGVPHRRLRKAALASALARFETNPDNANIVTRRSRHWAALAQLASDDFFSGALLAGCRPRGARADCRVQLPLCECRVV
jgi:hypothetical protein